jgi:hypothetical protein
MNVLDSVIDELLEILRQALYKQLKRNAPERKAGRKGKNAVAPTTKTVKRRPGPNFGNLLMTVAMIALGVFIFRRLMARRRE